jgi:alpha-D-xyloside xylohydrolase
MQLRESIRPYVTAIMKEANQTGTPALRPLFLEFPDDKMLWSLGDKVRRLDRVRAVLAIQK